MDAPMYLDFIGKFVTSLWAGYRSRYSDWLRAGRSGDRIPVGARFSATVRTGPGAHPASSTMGTGSFPGVKSGQGVTLTLHPLLVPWSWKGRAIRLLPLWAVRPVQSLSACTRVHCTFLLCNIFSAPTRTNKAWSYIRNPHLNQLHCYICAWFHMPPPGVTDVQSSILDTL